MYVERRVLKKCVLGFRFTTRTPGQGRAGQGSEFVIIIQGILVEFGSTILQTTRDKTRFVMINSRDCYCCTNHSTTYLPEIFSAVARLTAEFLKIMVLGDFHVFSLDVKSEASWDFMATMDLT